MPVQEPRSPIERPSLELAAAARRWLVVAAISFALLDAAFVAFSYPFAFSSFLDRILAFLATAGFQAALLVVVAWTAGAVLGALPWLAPRSPGNSGLRAGAMLGGTLLVAIGFAIYLWNSFVLGGPRSSVLLNDLAALVPALAGVVFAVRARDRRDDGSRAHFPYAAAVASFALGATAVLVGFLTAETSVHRRPELPVYEAIGEAPLRGVNVVLLVIDTMRADRLSSSGYQRQTTPELDRLAAEAVRFTNARSSATRTSPSMASLLTGVSPLDHGIVESHSPLDPKLPTLAEVLQEAGYRTIAIISNPNLSRALGFARGFEVDDELFNQERSDAEAVIDHAIAALRSADARPFFLWAHLIDPHAPYAPPARWSQYFRDDLLYARQSGTLLPAHFEQGRISPSTQLDPTSKLSDYEAAYDEEVRYADAEVGRLLDELRTSGRMKNTLFIFTADHGEAFGEHGLYFSHGLDTHDECARVPLVISAPGVLPHVDTRPVRHVDVTTTILNEIAGVATSRGGGRNVLRDWNDASPEERAALITAGTPRFRQYAISDGSWKLVLEPRQWREADRWATAKLSRWPSVYTRSPLRHRSYRPRLFNLISDPGEHSNLAGLGLEAEKRLLRWLLARIDASTQARVEPLDASQLDAESVERLRALGYL